MSEFECANGHPLHPGEYFCPICGEKIGRCDGLTRSEMRREEMEGDPDGGDRENGEE